MIMDRRSERWDTDRSSQRPLISVTMKVEISFRYPVMFI